VTRGGGGGRLLVEETSFGTFNGGNGKVASYVVFSECLRLLEKVFILGSGAVGDGNAPPLGKYGSGNALNSSGFIKAIIFVDATALLDSSKFISYLCLLHYIPSFLIKNVALNFYTFEF